MKTICPVHSERTAKALAGRPACQDDKHFEGGRRRGSNRGFLIEPRPDLKMRRIGRNQVGGHAAPIPGVIERIIEQSGTPCFCFKGLDENKPSGSIKIRVRDHRVLPAAVSRRSHPQAQSGRGNRRSTGGFGSRTARASGIPATAI
jgi:hypothetical protein